MNVTTSEISTADRASSATSAKYIGAIAAMAAIWLAVVLTGFFAKDFVSGSQQEHIHLAAIQNWFWGSIATAFILIPIVAGRRGRVDANASWYVLGSATAAIWLAVTLLSIYAPAYVTGSDPTTIPTATILSPIIGMVATGFVAVFVTVVNRTSG
jgi:hypothetical protein